MSWYKTMLGGTVAAVGLAAATAQAQDAVVWRTQGVTKNEIVLGTHTDLSGVLASFGVPTTNAAILRVEETNAAGGIHGRKIRFIVEDTQYQVPKAVQAGNKLINRDHIFAMVGGLGVAQNNAILVTQLKAGVPNLFPNTVARQMTEPFNPLKFSLFATYYDQVRAGTRHIVETKGKKAVCAMYQDTDFGKELVTGLGAQLAEMNQKIVERTTHKPTDQDFTADLIRLRGANCDFIVVGTVIRDTILAYSTARRMGWDVDMMGTTASYDTVVANAPGGQTDGFYSMGVIDPLYRDTATPEVARWMDKYKARFDTEASIAAALGYVIMDTTIHALDRAGPNLTTETLVKAIEGINGYRDIFNGPSINFGTERHVGSTKAILYQVQNGRWKRMSDPLGF